MKIELLNKVQLSAINKKNFAYPLAITEKDYFLAVVLQIIYNSNLKNKLFFKGGTAIHHLYLDQFRFSEDLDFTAIEPITIDDLNEVIKSYDFLEIVKYYPSNYSLKVERLKFLGPLNQANSIKIDINLEQKLILPVEELAYQNIYNVPITVKGMALKEICAEKIRAINERARYRDFYDLAMVIKTNSFEPGEIFEILEQKELKKPINRDLIFNNFKIANEFKESGADNIYYREEIPESEIKKIIGEMLDLIK